MNEKYRDIEVVRLLAQKAADLLSVDMIIYKTICDGAQIFKFSEDWKGPQVEIVHHNGGNSSENILPNTGDFRSIVTKTSGRSKSTRDLG